MNRHLLHKNKVEDFKAWLDTQSISHRPGRGDYEILQVLRADGQWFKLYARLKMPEHVTVQEPLVALVRRYVEGKDMPETEKMVTTTIAATTPSTSEAPWD